MESGNRSIHAPHCRLCCRYLLLLAACVSRQLTTKRYRKCQGICFVALQHNSDPRSSCDSVRLEGFGAQSESAVMVVCNCWLQSRWSREWRASIHAACSALHAEQQSSSSVQTTVALAASHIETVPARRSRAVYTGRGVLITSNQGHISPATKGCTCTAKLVADKSSTFSP